jgi:hypothetical protein
MIQNIDNTGIPFKKKMSNFPEWKKGRSAPISNSKAVEKTGVPTHCTITLHYYIALLHVCSTLYCDSQRSVAHQWFEFRTTTTVTFQILDFGLARQAEFEMTGYVATRYYRAPEIMLNWMHYNQTGKSRKRLCTVPCDWVYIPWYLLHFGIVHGSRWPGNKGHIPLKF